MKIRNGFVSNSSSSSFILGYAVIKDKEAFYQYCKKHKIVYDIDSNSYSEIKLVDGLSLNKNNRVLSCTNHTDLVIPIDLEFINKPILIIELGNNEGDEEFYNEAKDELDYSKAKQIDFWRGTQRALIELFNDSTIVDIKQSDIIYGVERNG